MAVRERQRLLMDQYYFLCRCEACSLSKQEEDENGPEGKGQWSDLLCGKCKGPFKVGVHCHNSQKLKKEYRHFFHLRILLFDQRLNPIVIHRISCKSCIIMAILYFKRSMEDGGTALTCLQPSCGLSMQPSEVKHHLQEIRANLEKAVDLMERERPGGSDTMQEFLFLFCFVFMCWRLSVTHLSVVLLCSPQKKLLNC